MPNEIDKIVDRYGKMLKHVTSVQSYILRKHKDTGIIPEFPSLLLAPLNKVGEGIVIGYKPYHAYVFPVYKEGEDAFYVNCIRDQMVVALENLGIKKEFDRYDGNTDWRAYIDLLFTRVGNAMKTHYAK